MQQSKAEPEEFVVMLEERIDTITTLSKLYLADNKIHNILYFCSCPLCPAFILLPSHRRQEIRKVLPSLLRPYEAGSAGDQSYRDS